MIHTNLVRKVRPRKARQMITGSQIRASRALLRWSATRLATAARIGRSSLHRIESTDTVPDVKLTTLYAVEVALNRAGIEFVEGRYAGEGGPGVRRSH